MKKRIILFILYYLSWYAFFLLCRVLFMLYNFGLSSQLTLPDIFRAFLYGSKLDLSAAGYFTLLPGILMCLGSIIHGKIIPWIINIYTIIMIFLSGFIVIADMELYRNWGFRMDATPLMYLKNPGEAAGSANKWLVVLLILFWIVFAGALSVLYLRVIGKKLLNTREKSWITSVVLLALTALLFLPVRFSLGVAPVNVGAVYFHKSSTFANHAAINVLWNLGDALSNLKKTEPYHLLEKDTADRVFKDLFHDQGNTRKLLNTDRPNVIILVLESFTAKIIEPLGGLAGITPNMTRFSKEGILFSNCYANGDRTDKGVIAVFNGFPAHPRLAVVNFPSKMENLTYLSKDLKKSGYYTEWVYGSPIDFDNFRAYLANSGYDKVISKQDFKPSECNAKWGVHDHIVLKRLLDECNKAREPFFMGSNTLSSHEPFDVPVRTVIAGKDEEHLFLNSAHYTDASLGDFIQEAQKAPWWKNTLIIMVADHGSRHPGNSPYNMPVKFHIPMLWLGGALKTRDTIVSTYCSQSDIAFTLLRQMNLADTNFIFSKDILSSSSPGFSFYMFNDGFGFLDPNAKMVFDNKAGKVTFGEGNVDDRFIKKGKSIMQVLSDEFSRR